jgi:hypothetical protein
MDIYIYKVVVLTVKMCVAHNLKTSDPIEEM